MRALILGANGSGKSAFAEKLAAGLSKGALYYVATMIPYGGEGRARVEKHRLQRRGCGFTTIERPSRVSELRLAPKASVLLEDVPNLLSNTVFGGCGGDAFDDIKTLCAVCSDCVMVSISGLEENCEYSCETQDYIRALNKLNRDLFDYADAVVHMRDGRSVWLKGEAYAFD